MKGIKLLAATAALTVSGVAVAGPNYTYGQLGYVAIDSVGNEDSGGFELNGSFGFADVFHVGAGLFAGEFEGGKSKDGADVDAYDIYFGYNPAVTDNVDAVIRVGFEEAEIKTQDDPRVKQESLFLSFGTRAMIAENFELNAFATYAGGKFKQSGSESEDFVNWDYSVAGIYSFTEMFAVGVKLDLDVITGFDGAGDATTGNAGTLFARVNF